MKLTGAQIIMECLLKRRRRHHLRLSRRLQPADVRHPGPVPADPAHPGAPRAGRRPRRRRLRARHRQGRRLLGHLRPRRHQPRHRHRQRLDGLRAAGLHHRRRRQLADRPRRLPGSGHHRHHDPDHEAQHASCSTSKTSRRRSRRRSTSPRPAAPAPCSSTSRATCSSRSASSSTPTTVNLPGYQPDDRGRPAARSSAPPQLIDEVRAPGDPRRPRRRHLTRLGRAGCSWRRRRRSP